MKILTMYEIQQIVVRNTMAISGTLSFNNFESNSPANSQSSIANIFSKFASTFEGQK